MEYRLEPSRLKSDIARATAQGGHVHQLTSKESAFSSHKGACHFFDRPKNTSTSSPLPVPLPNRLSDRASSDLVFLANGDVGTKLLFGCSSPSIQEYGDSDNEGRILCEAPVGVAGGFRVEDASLVREGDFLPFGLERIGRGLSSMDPSKLSDPCVDIEGTLSVWGDSSGLALGLTSVLFPTSLGSCMLEFSR